LSLPAVPASGQDRAGPIYYIQLPTALIADTTVLVRNPGEEESWGYLLPEAAFGFVLARIKDEQSLREKNAELRDRLGNLRQLHELLTSERQQQAKDFEDQLTTLREVTGHRAEQVVRYEELLEGARRRGRWWRRLAGGGGAVSIALGLALALGG